ncbi:MAG: FapA family protein [Oscillospiraceae bacterium]|nr:FapA family protein [Oscillospiraceae bacterium]
MAEAVIIRGTSLNISVTTDYHRAFLLITPPQGGECTVTCEEVMKALREKGVKYNINEEEIKEILERKIFINQIAVASWSQPVDGTDGKITYKFPMETDLVPQIKEDNTVDYKNLGFIRYVKKGTVIAEITPPTEGQCGYDVRGVPIRQRLGKPASYKLGENVELSEDGLTLVAAESGHLAYEYGGFNVFTTVTVNQDIDASTGNIEFAGDVIIKGDVTEGFKVSSAQNITVTGNVSGAALEAGGDIVVKSGITNSTVTAHGSITAQFCEYSRLTADGSVTAQMLVVCTCYAGAELNASKAVSGGKYTCLNNGTAGSLGSKTYAKTEVVIGDNAMIAEEKAGLEKRITEIDKQVLQCTQIIDFLNEKLKQLKKIPPEKEEMRGKAIKTKYTLQAEKKQVISRIQDIDERLAVKQFLRFDVRGVVYPGVKVILSGSTYTVEGEMRRVSFHLNEEGELQAMPL